MANAFILPFLFYRVAEKGQGVGRWLETFIIPAGKFARLMGLETFGNSAIRRKGKRGLNWKERLGISNLFLANDRLDAENDNRLLGKFFSALDYADLANATSSLTFPGEKDVSSLEMLMSNSVIRQDAVCSAKSSLLDAFARELTCYDNAYGRKP
uniref:Uncharacterized protein n=1 Tax=Vespula pensylvanica TaxID=30213 RepID=A0A834P590_VESPE|nr:hypothetical protein H0235_005766 [Vespula pensylvanica]